MSPCREMYPGSQSQPEPAWWVWTQTCPGEDSGCPVNTEWTNEWLTPLYRNDLLHRNLAFETFRVQLPVPISIPEDLHPWSPFTKGSPGRGCGTAHFCCPGSSLPVFLDWAHSPASLEHSIAKANTFWLATVKSSWLESYCVCKIILSIICGL